jgi:hypothetical protein
MILSLVYNQIRGFKTRHSQSSGVGGHSSTNSTRLPNDFEGYRLATGSSGRSTQYPNDPNQPPLTALVNRVKNLFHELFSSDHC